MNNISDLLGLIPAKYAPWLLLLPYVTRSYYALQHGGGLKGVWRSIWSGTNAAPDVLTTEDVKPEVKTQTAPSLATVTTVSNK